MAVHRRHPVPTARQDSVKVSLLVLMGNTCGPKCMKTNQTNCSETLKLNYGNKNLLVSASAMSRSPLKQILKRDCLESIISPRYSRTLHIVKDHTNKKTNSQDSFTIVSESQETILKEQACEKPCKFLTS